MLPLYGMLYGTYGSTYRRRLLTVSCLSRTGAKWRHQQMAQAVSRWPLTTDSRVRVRVTPCGICDEHSGVGTGFPPSSSVCPCLIIPSWLFTLVCDLGDEQAVCGRSSETSPKVLCSQEIATGVCAEPDESNPHPRTTFL
jgi:hypothetical protein